MSHIPTRLDVITDLRRSIMASFSPEKFNDSNFKIFLNKAEVNLKKIGLDEKTYKLALERLSKAKNSKSSIYKRREDIFTASTLI